MQTSGPLDEYSALNALIQDRGTQWSNHARAIKFDIEFRAIEDERRRVAKELHDEILPLLARLIRWIQTHDRDLKPAEGINTQIVNELHDTVGAFRDLLGELHAVDLEELGLVAALDNLCTRYSRFTERSVVFVEENDECNLSEHQQLCLYRAVQTVLRMFADSENDILLVSCKHTTDGTVVSARCVDKKVSSSDWLLENQDFNTFESWCAMAGAEVSIAGSQLSGSLSAAIEQFPTDLTISASKTLPPKEDILTVIGQIEQLRLKELDTIIAMAQIEWVEIINRDCELFKKLAVELERKKITEDIRRLVVPHLHRVDELAKKSKDSVGRKNVKQRMRVIANGVESVISELHPHLIDEVGLVASIRTLVARFRHATHIDTTMISNLWSDQFESIPLDKKFALYRITQEALNNIEKHSDATRTLVVVTKNAEQLVICIEDNGKGIQTDGTRTLSRGLRIIKERSSAIDASVSIQQSTSFGTGTLVTISLPCPGLLLDNQHLFQRIASARLG